MSDASTVLNLTSHNLFNLSARDALAMRLILSAGAHTPVNATLIRTGKLRPVTHTVFDFRKSAEAERNPEVE
jgi:aldose 1-epimerase